MAHDVDILARKLARMAPSPGRANATRQALIHTAGQRQVAPRRRSVMLAAAVCAGACAVMVGWAMWPGGEGSAVPPAVTAEPEFRGRILPSVGARYERLGDPGRETVRLHSGVMRFEVSPLAEHERFEVVVGSERVRVRGTIFHVVAIDGALVSVAVAEGVVEVHSGGRVAVLGAGDLWDARSGDDPAGQDVAEPPVEADVHVAPPPKRPRRRRTPAAPATASIPIPPPDAGAPAVVELAGESEFRAGWSAFERGDYGRAIVALGKGCDLSAAGAFVEDSCFWLAVSLERADRESLAVTAFRTYLRRFPRGARRDEARLGLGALLLARGERAEAAPLFRAAAKSSVPAIRANAERGLRASETR